jgi:hypothetical protein
MKKTLTSINLIVLCILCCNTISIFSQDIDTTQYKEKLNQTEAFKNFVNAKRVQAKLSILKNNKSLDTICNDRLSYFIKSSSKKNDKDYWDYYGIRIAQQMEIDSNQFNKGREMFIITQYPSFKVFSMSSNNDVFTKVYLTNSSYLRGIYKLHYTHQSCKSYYDLKTNTFYVLHLFIGIK